MPELLDTGLYGGIREDGELVAVAGVHVLSERHGVAAIGNVFTHPDHRRRGLGAALDGHHRPPAVEPVSTIGLNVGHGQRRRPDRSTSAWGSCRS